MSLRSGCGLQAELASTAFMNLTVSSSGDPHRDSCALLGKGNPPMRDSASAKIGMFDTNFTALFSCWFVFHWYCGQASTSSNAWLDLSRTKKLRKRKTACAREDNSLQTIAQKLHCLDRTCRQIPAKWAVD